MTKCEMEHDKQVLSFKNYKYYIFFENSIYVKQSTFVFSCLNVSPLTYAQRRARFH